MCPRNTDPAVLVGNNNNSAVLVHSTTLAAKMVSKAKFPHKRS